MTGIRVEHLFGRYDYDIRLGTSADGEISQISLLYGDNGTGKTTILNLIFHLLSSDINRGHKTRIAIVPFQNLTVTFSDGTTVFASRAPGNLTGAFELGFQPSDGALQTVRLDVDPETGHVPLKLAPVELLSLLKGISDLVPAVYYLGDNRTLQSDALPSYNSWDRRRGLLSRFDDGDSIEINHDLSESRESALSESIRRTQQQLYVELAHASTRGEADARQIYAEILGSIAFADVSADVEPDQAYHLERDLDELEKLSREFAAFHLGSAIDAAPFSESLSKADDRTMPIVAQVLRSFLNGQRARLKAFESLYKKMHKFVSITNEYMTDKRVELDITRGVSIHVPSGELDPTLLSSGERHLLLLLLNVFASSNESRVFLIDEPELSLNVKWQRQLVDSLLDLTEDDECQFLLATHSIELLSKHRDHVVKLSQ